MNLIERLKLCRADDDDNLRDIGNRIENKLCSPETVTKYSIAIKYSTVKVKNGILNIDIDFAYTPVKGYDNVVQDTCCITFIIGNGEIFIDTDILLSNHDYAAEHIQDTVIKIINTY